MSLTLTSRQTEEGFVVIEPEGRLTLYTANEMDSFLSQCISSGKANIILLGGKLNYIDNFGIGLVVNYQKNAKNLGGQIVLAGLQKRQVDLLNITGLNKLFTICGTLEEALEALRKLNTPHA